jgi:hypothetical protein
MFTPLSERRSLPGWDSRRLDKTVYLQDGMFITQFHRVFYWNDSIVGAEHLGVNRNYVEQDKSSEDCRLKGLSALSLFGPL